MTDTEEFMDAMLRDVPALGETYEAHMAMNDELLPHVLMGDVTRFALELAERVSVPGNGNDATLARLLEILDRGMASGSPTVQELVAVSFLENLDATEPGYAALARRLAPALAREMTRLHGGDPW